MCVLGKKEGGLMEFNEEIRLDWSRIMMKDGKGILEGRKFRRG